MRLTDDYINCDVLIKEANILYNNVKNKELEQLDKNYIDSMNRYINGYERYKERQLKQYIKDLEEYERQN